MEGDAPGYFGFEASAIFRQWEAGSPEWPRSVLPHCSPLVCPRSGLSQREVHDPAPTHVRPSAPAVVENLPARAAGGFESVGQVWHHDRIVPDARAFGYASDESSLIMWHTPSGNRILIGAEAELFRAGLASLLSSRRRLLHRGGAGPFARGGAENWG